MSNDWLSWRFCSYAPFGKRFQGRAKKRRKYKLSTRNETGPMVESTITVDDDEQGPDFDDLKVL